MQQHDLQDRLYREVLGDFSLIASHTSSQEEDWLAESYLAADQRQTVAFQRLRLTELDFSDSI